ncbi:MAG: response regulator [Pirellulaceae bacterium]
MVENCVEILLVEDNPNDVKLALHAFKSNHLANRVHVVRDGVEALEFLFGGEGQPVRTAAELPRVILLDLKLPLVDGHEVLRRIKADLRTRKIPVVVMTASKEERDMVETYELGVNSYIVKPVDFDQFTEAMRHLGHYWLLLNQVPAMPKPAGAPVGPAASFVAR